MSRETLKNLIELVPESEIDILYHVIVKFIPEADPEPEEIDAIPDRCARLQKAARRAGC